jgi:septal ring factor EnvC (AmiA/AmiB activator)
MSRAAIEDKLRELTDRIRRAREELAVLDEQLVVFRDTADETRMQAMVDESPLSRSEHGEAQRHADAHARTRDKLAATLSELERSRDDLLDRLVLESG